MNTAHALYEELLRAIAPIGEFQVEEKKTSIHLVRRTAFAGVHFRKDAILVTIKSREPLPARHGMKQERVSANRWHNDVRVESAEEIAGIVEWVRDAYSLSE